MTNYAVGLTVTLLAITALGIWPLGIALAVCVLFAGLALLHSYRQWMRHTSTPPHRAPLDALVRRQWAISGGVCLVAAVVVGAADIHTFGINTPLRVLQAVASAAGIALSAVFISSLVDWYWILPRVGGLGDHAAPCESPGERWKYPTAIWLLHRGLATALVVASIAAVPFFLAATLGDPATKTVLSVVGVAVGAGMTALNQRGLASITNAFNQPIYVGDTILVNQPGEGEGSPMVRRRAYVVDISVQGLKYQYLHGDEYDGPQFERKGHGPVLGGDEYRAIERLEGTAAVPCGRDGRGCSCVNWYCRNNPRAYDF
jgi:hypothetical protein